MTGSKTVKLRVPHQDLDRSSFFDCEETALANWISELPRANLGQTTRSLYQAVTELNRVRLLPEQRLALLDLLRPSIYFVTRALEKHYLNQPIALPEQSQKVANLAHTLHQSLASGYTIVAAHTAALGSRAGVKNPGALIAKALHRATTDYTINLLRHFELYEHIDKSIWNTLYQFYLLGEQHKVLDEKVLDQECGLSTLGQAYIRTLLLGGCRPNQLRQEHFRKILKPLTKWATLCQLQTADGDCIFVINPQNDSHPIYRSLFSNHVSNGWLGVNVTALVTHLRDIAESTDTSALLITDDEVNISRDLFEHLLASWSHISQRSFTRNKSDGELEICIGLSATHHFVSGELSFESFVEELGAKTLTLQHDNPFLKQTISSHARKKDVWDSTYEANAGKIDVAHDSIDYAIKESQSNDVEKNKYQSHTVNIYNASPQGYCVEWPESVPVQIKAGEIAGIKDPNSNNWSIAAIRWVGHDNGKFQLGLELLSPSAAPYGARIIMKVGGQAEYMRVMVLPEIISINQPITLLTPKMPFKVQQKVVLNQRGKEVQIQLTNKVNSAGAYNQFEFKKLSGTMTSSDSNNEDSDDEFSALWSSL